ncbi:MAG: diguanylate cyclase response regulator, partial [Bacteroidetes bacterium]
MLSKGNILVVDDIQANLALICDILNNEGYEVFPADSGELALASLEKNIPDLIFL